MKKESGITLSALVITIIVIFILASISINYGVDTLNESKAKDNNIDIIDFFDNDIFVEDDFIDFDHLGDSGAIKVTSELNKLIN